MTKMVVLTCATHSPDFSYNTGYGTNKSCLKHSGKPAFAVKPSRFLAAKGKDGNLLQISENTPRDAFILRKHDFSNAFIYMRLFFILLAELTFACSHNIEAKNVVQSNLIVCFSLEFSSATQPCCHRVAAYCAKAHSTQWTPKSSATF